MKQKIKIMEHKPELSDDEIRSYMNFETLLASRRQVSQNQRRNIAIKWMIPVVAITGIAIWLLFYSQNPKDAPHVRQNKPIEATPESPKSTSGKLPESSQKADKKDDRVSDKAKAKTPGAAQEDEKVEQPSAKAPAGEDIYIQAEPLNGYPALYEYLNTNLTYPQTSIPDSIQGVETVSFTINIEGKPEKVHVRQSLGKSFDEEAIRLISNMPAWKPATLNGKSVPSQMSIPLTFQIQKVRAVKP